MNTVSLSNIHLPASVLKAAEKKARHLGQTMPEYVQSVLERDILADRSFDEILAPVRAGFKKAKITEEGLDALVRRARRSVPHVKARQITREITLTTEKCFVFISECSE